MASSGVVDASLLISLGAASALDVLWDDDDHGWHITPLVRDEIRSEPTRSEISRALLAGDLSPTELDTTSPAELSALARWSRLVDSGEAEAIAIATTRGWVVGIEDLYAQRRLTEAVGSAVWLNAANLLLSAVQKGRLPLRTADAIFVRLDCYSGYSKRGVLSVSDLMR